MNYQSSKLPPTFWIISIVALIWNLMGAFTFFGQTFMGEEVLAALPEEQRVLYEAVPTWITLIFAIAVFSGTLGSIALILKKAFATPLFMISLVCVIIQMGYNVFFTNAADVFGTQAIVMPFIFLAISYFLYYYAKQCQAKGWIS